MEKSVLTQYSSAGGEKTLSCKGKTMVELLALALNSSKSGARLILYDLTELDRSLLERIAHAGKGKVLFDHR